MIQIPREAVAKMITRILRRESVMGRNADSPLCKESPEAPVRLLRDRGFPYWEVLRCPYCGQKHTHGAGDRYDLPTMFLGGRIAHCHPTSFVSHDEIRHLPLRNGAEYRLIAIEGKPTKVELDEHFPMVSGAWAPLHVDNWREDFPGSLPEWWYERKSQNARDRRGFTREEREAVWDMTGGRCFYCGVQTNPFRDFSIDHVVPVSKGGANLQDNLIPCCTTCNSSKRDSDLEAWRIQKGVAYFWFELQMDAPRLLKEASR